MRTMCTSVNGFLPRCARNDAPHGLAGRFLDPAVVTTLGSVKVGQHLPQAGDDGIGQRAPLVVDAAQRHFRRRHGPAAFCR